MEQRVGHRLGLLKHFFHPVCVCCDSAGPPQPGHLAPWECSHESDEAQMYKRTATIPLEAFQLFFFFFEQGPKTPTFLGSLHRLQNCTAWREHKGGALTF